MQYIDKVADIPVDVQKQVSTIQASQHDTQHIDEVVPALMESEIPSIPDADDPCLNEAADEDEVEHENKMRRLPMPAEAVSENRADEPDFGRFDDLVLPSPEGKTLFVNIASSDEAKDEAEKEQDGPKSRPMWRVQRGGRARPRTRVGVVCTEWAARCGRGSLRTWSQK